MNPFEALHKRILSNVKPKEMPRVIKEQTLEEVRVQGEQKIYPHRCPRELFSEPHSREQVIQSLLSEVTIEEYARTERYSALSRDEIRATLQEFVDETLSDNTAVFMHVRSLAERRLGILASEKKAGNRSESVW